MEFVSKEKIGVTVFAWEDSAYQISTLFPFSATVPFYGANPKPLEAVSKIAGPVLGINAGEDDRINSGIPAIVESMIKYKKTFEMKCTVEQSMHSSMKQSQHIINLLQMMYGRKHLLSLINIYESKVRRYKMNEKKQNGDRSSLLWDSFVNWTETIEKIQKNVERQQQVLSIEGNSQI